MNGWVDIYINIYLYIYYKYVYVYARARVCVLCVCVCVCVILPEVSSLCTNPSFQLLQSSKATVLSLLI
jgi:hypothetical protein